MVSMSKSVEYRKVTNRQAQKILGKEISPEKFEKMTN